jgi:hypothetical protein
MVVANALVTIVLFGIDALIEGRPGVPHIPQL